MRRSVSATARRDRREFLHPAQKSLEAFISTDVAITMRFFCIDIKIYTYIYKYITSVNNNNLLRALSRFVITSCYVEDLSMLLSNDCLPLIIDSPV